MDGRPSFRTNALGWGLLSLVLFPLTAQGVNNAVGAPPAGLEQAQILLQRQDGPAALAAFEEIIAVQPSFAAFLGAAQASALADRPREALWNYRRALDLARDDAAEQRMALFGIARMHLWLEQYQEAERTYADLLSRTLTAEDRSAASAGLMRSLSFQDKPMQAYRSVPPGSTLSPAEKIEQARAALWAGWPDKAAAVLAQGIPVEPATRMARELEGLRGEAQVDMANTLALRSDFTKDSDDMRIRKSELSAGMRLPDAGTVGLVGQNQGFEQHGRHRAENSVQARFSSRVEDRFWYSLQAGPASYGDWNTALWSGNALYRPDDETRYEAFIIREAVETFVALDRHLTLDTAGLTAEYTPHRRLMLAASAFRQSFSDDNHRLGGNGKIGTLLSERLGLGVQIRARYFEDSRTDTVGYFNPDRFHEEQLLLVLNSRMGNSWRLYGLAGPGIQNVAPGDHTSTWLTELSVWGKIGRSFSISLDSGYSNSSIASASGYRRQYAGISLSYLW